jgi:serine/threonine protein kinase
MSQADPPNRDTLPPGKVIGGYEIIFLIGLGGFGCVYKVKDKRTQQMFAMKTESLAAPKKALPSEIECLEALHDDCFPRLRTHGTEKRFSYLVMNLLGASIAAVRRQSQKLDPSTCLHVARQMLTVIASLHECGYVHRDIKPSNFLLQQNASAPLVLVDFGLCKKHIDPHTNHPFPAAAHAPFAGTKKYASPSADENRELGRKDDLFSWLYSVVEMWSGALPWAKDGVDVAAVKRETKIEALCEGMPRAFIEICPIVAGLKYEDDPPYDRLRRKVEEGMDEAGVGDTFDWRGLYTAHSNLGDLAMAIRTGQAEAKAARGRALEEEGPGGNDGEGGCCRVQ